MKRLSFFFCSYRLGDSLDCRNFQPSTKGRRLSSHFISFPQNFLWGSATSSFQIEGSPLADGAAKSNWYDWSHTPGKIANGDHADTACDHYHRYKEDIALMRQLGLQAYRFSISWPRIIPERGRVNEKGLDFYRRLLDELQKTNIIPSATLFHWEVPNWAEGGWENRETALAFGEYAEAVFKKLGRDIPYWATHNEPVCTAQLGFLQGHFPPGKSGDKGAYANVVHHLNLSHGLAVRAFQQSGQKGEIGWVQALNPFRPATDHSADVRHAENLNALQAGIFLDPAAGRGYPDFFYEFAGKPSAYRESDLKIIAGPVDFLGVNHYFPSYARYAPGSGLFDNDGAMPAESWVSDFRWEVDSTALYDLLVSLQKNYNFKHMFITENGTCTRDSFRTLEQTLEDDVRVHYLGHYLAAVRKAMSEGVRVSGYFAWSLMDNFEWAQGFDPRFGLIHVDFKTQKRTWKRSAHWYKKAIADRGFNLDDLPKNPSYRTIEELAPKK
jgi:beta-glucosidase